MREAHPALQRSGTSASKFVGAAPSRTTGLALAFPVKPPTTETRCSCVPGTSLLQAFLPMQQLHIGSAAHQLLCARNPSGSEDHTRAWLTPGVDYCQFQRGSKWCSNWSLGSRERDLSKHDKEMKESVDTSRAAEPDRCNGNNV